MSIYQEILIFRRYRWEARIRVYYTLCPLFVDGAYVVFLTAGAFDDGPSRFLVLANSKPYMYPGNPEKAPPIHTAELRSASPGRDIPIPIPICICKTCSYLGDHPA